MTAARKALVVGALAMLCLLAGRPASAWVPTPNKTRMAAATRPVPRYVPIRSHADAVSGHDAPAVLFSTHISDRRPTASADRRRRGAGAGADDWGSAGVDRFRHDGPRARSVASVPSYWGATHLLI